MTTLDLAALRRDYALSSLDERDVDPDPDPAIRALVRRRRGRTRFSSLTR